MILKRLTLENIRSYRHEQIDFPLGSLLLSGDIGSGKSTILLAIDFVLFGIQKNLSGASLLRHGKEDGFVELDFEINKKKYTIRRTLKRKKDSVRQSAGYVIADSVKKDLTAQEAKSFILELLGYPQQALTKDSALVYRYTVYTAQEQMKHIIESNSEERLDIIRRLFGMDKYKRIASNAEIFAKELRARSRELSGRISDLDEKIKEKDALSRQVDSGKKELETLCKKVADQEEITSSKKEELDSLQKGLELLAEKKQKYSALKTEFDLLKTNLNEAKQACVQIDPKISELKAQLQQFEKLEKPKNTPTEISKKIEVLESSAKDFLTKSASLSSEVASLTKILEKGICGTCKQEVSDRNSFSKGIEERKKLIEKLSLDQKNAEKEIEKLRNELLTAQTHDSKVREKTSIEGQIKDKAELKLKYSEEVEQKQVKLKSLAESANTLAKEIKEDTNSQKFKERQADYEAEREKLENVRREESVLKEKLSGLNERAELLDLEIKKKQKDQKQMEKLVSYDRWIREFFVNLMGTIERHVLVSVQNEFNSLFYKWFSMLVMDEGLSARVNEDFSVVIEQEGYETEYSFMSGGERTAVALAYRLALNRVINDLTEKIKTKDLLILDEPTDGFSSEQMSSVRDVLNELNTIQTIIVSHEPRVEGFVDRTFRISKDNNVSSVLSE